MGRDDYRWEDRGRRRRSPYFRDDDGDDYTRPARRPRSNGVISVAVLNFVVGPIVMVCGMCGMLATEALKFFQPFFLGLPGMELSPMATIIVIAAIFVWSCSAIVAATGLFYRASWARMLALLLGGFSAMVGLLYLVAAILFLTGDSNSPRDERFNHFIFSCGRSLFFLGYCTWTYLVLLHPRRAAEFR